MTQQYEVRGRATSKRGGRDNLSVVYHQTEVVKTTPKSIKLDTGGWFTSTTKTRMNQASREFRLGYDVSQEKGEWYVDHKGKRRRFQKHSMTLRR